MSVSKIEKPWPQGIPHGLATDPRPFGERLLHWQLERGLDAGLVAELLGVSAGEVARWQSGKGKPSDEGAMLAKLRAAQDQAGERPGEDSRERVAEKWAEFLSV